MTGDGALLQRLQINCTVGRASTVRLLGADPYREFTGVLESVAHVKVERPQQWEVVMVERGATSEVTCGQ